MTASDADRSAHTAAQAEPRTPLALARSAAGWLASRGIGDGRLEAELLLAHSLGVKRLDLYLQHDRPLTPDETDRFREMVRRRGRREPLQYVVGRVQFREIELAADARALIPRPETEVLVGVVVDWMSQRSRPRRALDVGTGTGAIALSLLAEDAAESVVATDTSGASLDLAAENAAALGSAHRLELRPGPLYAPLRIGERFDAIISNPPYIAESERTDLAPEVLDWEPATALFGGARGLDVIEPLVAGAPDRLAAGGLLALEVGAGQAEEVAALARSTVGLGGVGIVEDLAGRPRIVTAVRA